MHLLRLVRRKRIARLVAAAFLMIAFFELGSHGIIASGNPNAWDWCKTLHTTSPSADCPHKRHQPGPQNNPNTEIAYPLIVVNELELPVPDPFIDTPEVIYTNAHALSRPLAAPFRPPKTKA
ncbi:MAG: hypothetical protein ABJB34_01225, partial [Acidobacteriota bacterium]